MRLTESISQIWKGIQQQLFPYLEEEVGELNKNHRRLVATLEMVQIEAFLRSSRKRGKGRPPKERAAIARAFVAKAVYNCATTRVLLDRLQADPTLRRLCGWEAKYQIPGESTFSRAFDAFAQRGLAQRVHAALVEKHLSGQLIGHIARDATKIEARERPRKKARAKREKGQAKRMELQKKMALQEMLDELPKACDVGRKTNSKGHYETWIGYKLHLDAADGQIPVSCVLTSASLHESQVALPLAEMTRRRVVNLYDLMDAAYDAAAIRERSESLGHVALIDNYNRRGHPVKTERLAEQERLAFLNFQLPEQARYKTRTMVERVNSRLKDEFGGRTVRVRGHAKVFEHLMFGILALTADQLLRLAT